MGFGSADLDLMLADFGVPIRLGDKTSKCIFDVVDGPMLTSGETFAGRVITVTVKTGALEGLEEAAEVTVDGVGYRVVSAYAFDDGAFTRAIVVEV